MKCARVFVVGLVLVTASTVSVAVAQTQSTLEVASETSAPESNDWLTWRGPNGDGIAIDQAPVTQWDKESNVVWKAEVPGRGHSSPTIVGNRIYLTTASISDGTQSALCYDRVTGKLLWNRVVHEGGLTSKIHGNNSRASHTVASDGTHVFCLFVNGGQVFLTKFDLDGERIWQKSIGEFQSDFRFGAGASPIIWNSRLYVASECSRDSFVMALDLENGKPIWRTDRAKRTSYSTPVIAHVAGRDQLLLSGANTVKGYDPENGKELWSVPTEWAVSCATMVWKDDLVFASGGFPDPQTLAIKADGSAKVVWENRVKCYEQSLLVHDGCVYGLSDNGICYCWDAETGKENWKQRMKRKVSASPVLAGGHLYFTTEDGSCYVVKPNPKQCDIVSENDLGDSAFATPTFVDDKIYTRVGVREGGKLQEYLYCLGSQ